MFRPAIRLALGGRDTISFQAGDGDPFVNYFTRKRVIDLANGTDPYGGIVTLTGVENVRDTSAGDLSSVTTRPTGSATGFSTAGRILFVRRGAMTPCWPPPSGMLSAALLFSNF